MGKYTLGIMIISLSVGGMVAINIGVATGILSVFTVWGFGYVITGLVESIYKLVVKQGTK